MKSKGGKRAPYHDDEFEPLVRRHWAIEIQERRVFDELQQLGIAAWQDLSW